MSGNTWVKEGMKVIYQGTVYEVKDWFFTSPKLEGHWNPNWDECWVELKGLDKAVRCNELMEDKNGAE